MRWISSIDERAGLGLLADRQHLEVGLAQLVLVELRARHRDRELAAVDDRHARLAQLAQHPRQRAEVVLVAVGDDDRLDVVDPLAQVAEVGQHEVDAHHLGGREAQPAVHDDDPAVVLDDRHVLADLAQPPERQDAQRSPVAQRAAAVSSSPWAASVARICSRSASSTSTSGRRRPPTSWPEHGQGGLDRRGARGDEHRRVDVLQRRVELGPAVGLVVASGASAGRRRARRRRCRRRRRSRACARDVVVAGQHGQPVDRLQLVAVGLLDRLDALDLGQLGQQVGRHVGRRAARDVVEDHRRGRPRRRRRPRSGAGCPRRLGLL